MRIVLPIYCFSAFLPTWFICLPQHPSQSLQADNNVNTRNKFATGTSLIVLTILLFVVGYLFGRPHNSVRQVVSCGLSVFDSLCLAGYFIFQCPPAHMFCFLHGVSYPRKCIELLHLLSWWATLHTLTPQRTELALNGGRRKTLPCRRRRRTTSSCACLRRNCQRWTRCGGNSKQSS